MVFFTIHTDKLQNVHTVLDIINILFNSFRLARDICPLTCGQRKKCSCGWLCDCV